ncbi:hypothetical protein ACT3CD_06865 [Geofilum sp. OHC36d9]
MKKIVLFAVVLFTVALTFSSCKSAQPCPAYGQVEAEVSVNA